MTKSIGLPKQLAHRLAVFDDRDGPPDGTHIFFGGVDVQTFAEGLKEIADGYGAVFDIGACGIGFADNLAAT